MFSLLILCLTIHNNFSVATMVTADHSPTEKSSAASTHIDSDGWLAVQGAASEVDSEAEEEEVDELVDDEDYMGLQVCVSSSPSLQAYMLAPIILLLTCVLRSRHPQPLRSRPYRKVCVHLGLGPDRDLIYDTIVLTRVRRHNTVTRTGAAAVQLDARRGSRLDGHHDQHLLDDSQCSRQLAHARE